MESFMKDLKEVKNAKASKREDFLSMILCDARLMNELHALGFGREEVESNLPLLLTYLEQRDAEEDPKHLLEAPYPGMKMKLVVDDSGNLSFELGPNDENKAKTMLDVNFIYRDYPDEWLNLRAAALKNQRFKSLSLALKKLGKTGKKWLYIEGDSGSGKSYFLAAILNNYALKGKTVAFMNSNKRLDELKNLAINNRKEFEGAIKALQTAEHLVIDDFGNEFRSDYVRDQILLPILFERGRLGLNTYFTSEYSLEDIEELYGRPSKIDGKRVVNLIRRNIDEVVYLQKGIENIR